MSAKACPRCRRRTLTLLVTPWGNYLWCTWQTDQPDWCAWFEACR